MPRKNLSREKRAAWRDARVTSYRLTYSAAELAGMLVDLEDRVGEQQFEYDDQWPASVRHMKR